MDSFSPVFSTEISPVPSQDLEERFLQFQLRDGELALLALDQIAGVMTLSLDQILPVPGMGLAVMGGYEWRGAAIWVVDLGILAGLPPISWGRMAPRSITLLALQTPGRAGKPAVELGIGVTEVGDIETVAPDQIQPPNPGIFSAELQALLRGYLPQSGLPVFEVEWVYHALRSRYRSTA